MLTLKKLSIAQASTYYSKDNYYTKQQGEYIGKLKSELGLDSLTHDSFNQLLQGINPTTGESLIHSKKGKKEVVPAFDFTFSPSKSVSIAYELAIEKGDTKLADFIATAHDRAVNKALEDIENEIIKTRVQKNKKRVSLTTGNLLAAKFQHDINRNLEPQLHTHSVIFNFTKVDDKYRAIDASNLLKKGSPIIKNLGQFYRECLKEELITGGFGIRDTDRQKSFYELKGIDDEMIQAFSSRSADIKAKVQQLKKQHPHLSDSQLNMRAFFNTRVSKKDVNRDEVRTKNIKLLSKLTDTNSLLEKLQPKQQPIKKVKVDEKEIYKVLHQVKKELNKYQKTPLNLTTKVMTKLDNDVEIGTLFEKIKTKENQEQQKLKTMHEAVLSNLLKTKLNTQKLFKSLNHLKEFEPTQREEIIENARPSNRDRFIEKFNRISNTNARAKQTHHRDVGNIDTTNERGRTTRDELERYDDVSNRTDRETSINYPRITKEDLRIAEQGQQEYINNRDKGVER